ncbi:MAG: hypothetical protein KF773_20830 [Deltaproteobacteria bacterium]|nr:hypothetical protein [Deltaproteobacteria bacterium]
MSTRPLALSLLFLAACARPPAKPADGGTETIDVDLAGADLVDALRTIATSAQVSLFVDPDISGTVTLRAHATPWRDALATVARAHALRIQPLATPGTRRPSLWVTRLSSPPAPRTEFTGAPIELSFLDTPVRDAARALGDLAKTPISVDADVEASVTLRMRNIPWDLALYHLAQKYALHVVTEPAGLRLTR